MGRSIIPKGGNDKVMTPMYLANDIISFYKPQGVILEPCKGSGNFIFALESYAVDCKQSIVIDWCEIDEGVDFFDYNKKVDWIITNPPFSKFRAFLQKSMDVADNIVFVSLINAFFFKARLRDIKNAGFGIKTINIVDTPPKPWPQFGIQTGVVCLQRDYKGPTDIIYGL